MKGGAGPQKPIGRIPCQAEGHRAQGKSTWGLLDSRCYKAERKTEPPEVKQFGGKEVGAFWNPISARARKSH